MEAITTRHRHRYLLQRRNHVLPLFKVIVLECSPNEIKAITKDTESSGFRVYAGDRMSVPRVMVLYVYTSFYVFDIGFLKWF